MTEEQLIRKIEWADKRCSLKGEPFTETQKDYLKFVFAGMTSEKSDFIGHVSFCDCPVHGDVTWRNGFHQCNKCDGLIRVIER